MPKRKTIGNDPLAQSAVVPLYPVEQSAEIVPMPIVAAAKAAREETPIPPPSGPVQAAATSAPAMARGFSELSGAARRMVGGNLEILGGDLGSGNRAIWPQGRDKRVGFVAPNGRSVDIARDLATVQAWGDGAEHRYLSAAGWAWVLGSLGGIPGAIAGGGLRLLEPRRMMVVLGLRDGTRLVARSDAVTVASLKAFVFAMA